MGSDTCAERNPGDRGYPLLAPWLNLMGHAVRESGSAPGCPEGSTGVVTARSCGHNPGPSACQNDRMAV
jgi:hypothetical protein